jgi:hypothetical protein
MEFKIGDYVYDPKMNLHPNNIAIVMGESRYLNGQTAIAIQFMDSKDVYKWPTHRLRKV